MNVSVIIPCHNAASYVAQAIGSALDQTHPPLEVVVVDDASTDGSKSIVQELVAQHPRRVRHIHEESRQAAKTRNIGADHARGDALMFLDADDVLGPDVLEALSRALRSQPEGIALGPWYRLELVGGRWIKKPPSCSNLQPWEDALDGWLTGWYHPPCSVLWSRPAFALAGRWEERWNPNDDGDLMMRAIIEGVPLVMADTGASFYRRTPPQEQSLSDTRATDEGTRARLATLERVARLLEDRDLIDRYRPSLAHAFYLIAGAASESSDLCDRAKRRGDHFRPPFWHRSLLRTRALFGEARAAFERALSRTRGTARKLPASAQPDPFEVTYGLARPDAGDPGASPRRSDRLPSPSQGGSDPAVCQTPS